MYRRIYKLVPRTQYGVFGEAPQLSTARRHRGRSTNRVETAPAGHGFQSVVVRIFSAARKGMLSSPTPTSGAVLFWQDVGWPPPFLLFAVCRTSTAVVTTPFGASALWEALPAPSVGQSSDLIASIVASGVCCDGSIHSLVCSLPLIRIGNRNGSTHLEGSDISRISPLLRSPGGWGLVRSRRANFSRCIWHRQNHTHCRKARRSQRVLSRVRAALALRFGPRPMMIRALVLVTPQSRLFELSNECA